MLKMNRADVVALSGRAPAPTPAPMAAAPAPAAPDTRALVAMQEAMVTMANSIAALPGLIAAAQPQPSKPQQLEGIIHRDSKGRLAKVVITISK